MIKQQLIKDILRILQKEMQGAISAAQQAHDGATHEQSKAETQYDTLGLEHAYLAQGQSRRIKELVHAISLLENWKVESFTQDDEIYLGALVTLLNTHSKQFLHIFIAPSGGGVNIEIDKVNYQVITAQTPLGQSLIGLTVGETVLPNNGQPLEITHLI